MDPLPSPRPSILGDPDTLRLLAESLKASGVGRLHLRGISMLPTLREGWRLHVRSLPASELRVGEVGIFIHHNLLTIHRLIWKKTEAGQERFIFQGDNSPEREVVDGGAILGRVEAAEEDGGHDAVRDPIPVGNDARAFFYRNAFRVHSLLKGLLPSAALPGAEGSGGRFYRLLRALFRLLEPLFSPHPRR